MVVCLSFLSGKKQLIKAEKKGIPSFLVQKKGETRVSGYHDMKKSKKLSRDIVLRDMKEDVRSLITDLTTRYQIIGKSLKLLKMTGEPSFYADSPIADEEEKYDETVEHLKTSVLEFKRYCSAEPYRDMLIEYISQLRDVTEEDEIKAIYQHWLNDLNKTKVDCNFMHRNLVTEIQQMIQYVRRLKAKELDEMDESVKIDTTTKGDGSMVFTVEETCARLDEMCNPSAWYFLENGSTEVKSSFLDKMIEKIKSVTNSIVTWIQEFYQKHFTKKVETELEEKMKKDPSFKNKKIRVRDNDKIAEIQTATVNAIQECKRIDEVEATMKKYRKQRNVLIAATTAVTITATAGLAWLRKSKDKKINEIAKTNKTLLNSVKKLQNNLSETEQRATSEREKYTSKIKEQNEIIKGKNRQIHYLAAKAKGDDKKARAIKRKGTEANINKAVADTGTKIKDSVSKSKDAVLEKAKITAVAEVFTNMSSDVKSGVSEIYDAVRSTDKSALQKATSVAHGVNSLVNAPSNATNRKYQAAKKDESLKKKLDMFDKLDRFFTAKKKEYNTLTNSEDKSRWKEEFNRKYKDRFNSYMELKKELQM